MANVRDEMREELATRVEAFLAVSFPTLKVLYSNHKFSYPTPPAVFLTSELDEFLAGPTTLGQPRKLKMMRGFWIVEIFAPENQGSKQATRIADALETEFGGTSFKTLACDTTTFGNSVLRDDRLANGWHRWTLMFPYRIQQVG